MRDAWDERATRFRWDIDITDWPTWAVRRAFRRLREPPRVAIEDRPRILPEAEKNATGTTPPPEERGQSEEK